MCGIIGIISAQPVAQRLLEGLRRLEYRGYDSAGIATLINGRIERRRAEGKLVNLVRRVAEDPLAGTIGIGHTRWATHGRPNEVNAHPHATHRVAVVHNGIIENHRELREELTARGARFETETDTETVAWLMTDYLDQGMAPLDAAAATLGRLHGAFALVILIAGEHDLLIAGRQGAPLAIGLGEGEMFIASDALALAGVTDRLIYLAEGDWAEVRRDHVVIRSGTGEVIERPVRRVSISGTSVEKGTYRHFMLKEIHEQPQVVGATLNAILNPATNEPALPALPFDPAKLTALTGSACGTAFYAAQTARTWIEQLARLPVELDIASELRYREPPMQPGGAALFVSQSGETADTLEAMRYARRSGQAILAVVNVPESTIAREADLTLHTHAGPEIGVASTKAFTTQLATLAALAVALGQARGTLTVEDARRLGAALREAPASMAETLQHEKVLEEIARDIALARDVLYLGRGAMYPLALEGALKLKEISYIHAEGYAAGEMKHGPIALIDQDVPVVVLAPPDPRLFEKTASNVEEVAARGGQVLLISDAAGCARLKHRVRWAFEVPACDPFVAPLVYALPIQLLAYHVAVLKGTDVDQPRNLAKAVTVE